MTGRRILLRAYKSPLEVLGPQAVLARNAIGGNAGNLLFAHAAHRLLSTSGVTITTDPVLGLRPDDINDRFDVLVLPLANAFRPGYRRELVQLTGIIEQLRIPVVVLGVNTQLATGTGEPAGNLRPLIARFLRAVLDRSPRVGVRGELTAAYLSRIGFGPEHVSVIGCPSMFLDGPSLQVPRSRQAVTVDSRLALSASHHVRPSARMAREHAARYPHLLYVAQDYPTLELLLTGRYHSPLPAYDGIPASLDHPLISQDRTIVPIDVVPWLAVLRRAEFGYGSRVHGTIAAVLAGAPALLLNHDSRTRELADYHRIPTRELAEFADADPAELVELADPAPMLAAHPERWTRFAAYLAEHDLRHTFDPGESTAEFDRRLAACRFPEPVRVQPRLLRELTYARYRTGRAIAKARRSVHASTAPASPGVPRTLP